MTQTLTTTSQTPQRITCTHYQIQGETHPERIYNLTYENGKWNCDCPDKRHNHNDNCKHRRALVAHINAQLEAQQAHSQAADIIEDMQRAISSTKAKVEEETDDLEENFNAQMESLKRKHAEQLEDLQAQIDDMDALLNLAEDQRHDMQLKYDSLREMLEQQDTTLATLEARIAAFEAQPKRTPRKRKPRTIKELAQQAEPVDFETWKASLTPEQFETYRANYGLAIGY